MRKYVRKTKRRRSKLGTRKRGGDDKQALLTNIEKQELLKDIERKIKIIERIINGEKNNSKKITLTERKEKLIKQKEELNRGNEITNKSLQERAKVLQHISQQGQHTNSTGVKLFPLIGFNQLNSQQQAHSEKIAAEWKKEQKEKRKQQHEQFISTIKEQKYYTSLVPIKQKIYALREEQKNPYHNQEQIQKEIDELITLGRNIRSKTNTRMKSLYNEINSFDLFNKTQRQRHRGTININNTEAIAKHNANDKRINEIDKEINEIKASNTERALYWKAV
jgi:hypothetical protein